MKINFHKTGEKPLKRFSDPRPAQVTPLKQGVNERRQLLPSPLFPVTQRESAVALVVTLILLSVITFMAVAFLVMSRSEKGAVNNTMEQTGARFYADSAQQRAITELLSRVMAHTNESLADFLVSTNYINTFGFNKSGGAGYYSLTNVCYNYPNGVGLNKLDDIYRNLANLLYNPRAPVWVSNRFFGSNEFVYYIDMNRNGRYDTNGYLPVMNATNGFYNTNHIPIATPIPGNTLYNFFAGDPEWIGILERPDFPHSPSNKFVGRIAYFVVPTGKTLDINHIHNYSKLLRVNMADGGGDGSLRNEGVGTWEINLAAFLMDLNTNYWFSLSNPYFYYGDDSNPGNFRSGNKGAAFEDALRVVRYRYNGNYKTLASIPQLFGNAGFTNFVFDGIDGFTDGPQMLGLARPYDNDPANAGFDYWSGSENALHFINPQELFDRNKLASGVLTNVPTLSDRLLFAGTNNDSYNRYTFSRLLAQIGTDSAPEPPDRMNLNFDNLRTNSFNGARSVTNYLPWQPIDFFTNAAARLLADTFPNDPNVSIGRIQIWPTNYYTPSVHRLLQLAANMYDATTTNIYPSVFRPSFAVQGSNVFINGYSEITDNLRTVLNPTWLDLNVPEDRANVGRGNNVMFYGIPLVVGAKKGYPNFNEFAMQTQVRVTRKLEFRRPPGGLVNETNQMYVVAISNIFGVEAWNSYSNIFSRQLRMTVVADTAAVVTNELGTIMLSNRFTTATTITSNNWAGFQFANAPSQPSFAIPLDPSTNVFMFLTNSTYSQAQRRFIQLSSNFERNQGFPVPHLFLTLNTRLRFFLVDVTARTNRIVDYVNLSSTEPPLDISEMLERDDPNVQPSGCGGPYVGQSVPDNLMWCTNKAVKTDQAPTYGVLNQIALAMGNIAPSGYNYAAYDQDPNAAVPGSIMCQINFFRGQFDQSPKPLPNLTPCTSTDPIFKSNVFHAPFVPRKDIYLYTSWQANDPLVHYTIPDLTELTKQRVEFNTTNQSSLVNIRHINGHYEPWAAIPNKPGGSSSLTRTNMSLKDALITRSDDWDFPTNKLPNVGWLGRIHRGTPWQTVYLKSTAPDVTNTWPQWSGHIIKNWDNYGTTLLDSYRSNPTNDYHILDRFTTALDDNALRGQLSVNQTNLAAWSAVLSGVCVVTNIFTNSYTFIEPAGVYDPAAPNAYPPVLRIVNGINNLRTNIVTIQGTNYPVYPNGMFTRMGDILAVPELTEKSPYLAGGNPNLMNDEVYERIPQQILSLLTGDSAPRFVIYAYGQSLKPADHSLVTSGPFFGMCTNYQVTAEVATRTVVRIEGVKQNPHTMKNLHPIIESFNVLPPD